MVYIRFFVIHSQQVFYIQGTWGQCPLNNNNFKIPNRFKILRNRNSADTIYVTIAQSRSSLLQVSTSQATRLAGQFALWSIW